MHGIIMVTGDAGTFWFKELWLEPKFFAARAVAFVMLWSVFSRILVNHSRRQDLDRSEAATSASGLISILFLAMFAVSISLAGVDWIMALEPMWFSTMWGVYQFSGLILGTLAAMIVACILLRRHGPLAGVFHEDHLHDLSKLLLGFSCFWMYIWFSQYMLIWYSNIPEETSYFIRRTHGPWGPIVLASIVLNWVIPFFVAAASPVQAQRKCDAENRGRGAVGTLGRFVHHDLSTRDRKHSCLRHSRGGHNHWSLLPVPLLFIRSFAAAASVPQNDPWLADSLHYHA